MGGKIVIFILLNVILGSVYSQSFENSLKIDSLTLELEDAENQLQESKILYEIGLEYFYRDNITAKEYFSKIEELIPNIKVEDPFLVDFYNSNAALYANLGEFEISDSLYDLSYEYSKILNYDVLYNQINAQTGKAVNDIFLGNFEKAIESLFELEKKTTQLDSTNKKHLKIHSLIHSNIAISYANMGQLNEGIIYFEKHLNYYEKKLFDPNNTVSIGELLDAYNNVALCHDLLNQTSQSITNYQKALKIADEHEITDRRKNLCSNLSSMFLKQKNYQKSIYYASQALGENNDWNANAYNNIGISKMKLGDFKNSNTNLFKALEIYSKQKRKNAIGFIYTNIGINYMNLNKYDSSLLYLQKSLKIQESNKGVLASPRIYEALGNCYFKMNQLEKALPYLLKAEEGFDQQESISEDQIYNRDHLYNFYKKKNDFRKSVLWLEKKYKLEKTYDSLRNNANINELEAKYESQQKENKILKLSNDNIKKEAEITKTRNLIYVIVVIFLVITILSYTIWLRQKQIQKMNLLRSTVNASEEEKNRIGKELHDGIASRILKVVYETDKKHIELSNELLNIYQQLRELSHQLEGTPLHSEPLYEKLIDIIPNNNPEAIFAIKIIPQNLELEEPYGNHIYRLIQELITNNLKHANASFTLLHIKLEDDLLKIEYKDNGIGSSNFSVGYGYNHINNRVKLMTGSIQINTDKNVGFEVDIQIPYQEKNDKN